MGKPKKRTTPRRTGARRSHMVPKLAKAVNAKLAALPTKVRLKRQKTAKQD